MENSKKYSDADNSEVTEGRVSLIRSTDAEEELVKDAKGYNPPSYVSNAEIPVNEEPGVPPQSTRPVEDEKSINWRALDRGAKTYGLDKFNKNIMLIFTLCDIPGDEHRDGIVEDVAALKNTFEPLGFECTEYRDLNESEIFDKLETVIETLDCDIGCVAVCILTHGDCNGLLWAKDKTYSELKVMDYFEGDRNLKLLTKPKLLIIQACRCLKPQLEAQVTIVKDNKDQQHYYLPVEADILVLHGSALHIPDISCKKNGFWLIQTFCSIMEKLAAYKDLESILVEVKSAVTIYKSNEKTNDEGETQIPVVTSTLIRKLNFNRSGFKVKDVTGQITLPSPEP